MSGINDLSLWPQGSQAWRWLPPRQRRRSLSRKSQLSLPIRPRVLRWPIDRRTRTSPGKLAPGLEKHQPCRMHPSHTQAGPSAKLFPGSSGPGALRFHGPIRRERLAPSGGTSERPSDRAGEGGRRERAPLGSAVWPSGYRDGLGYTRLFGFLARCDILSKVLLSASLRGHQTRSGWSSKHPTLHRSSAPRHTLLPRAALVCGPPLLTPLSFRLIY